mgnify:CR=1 FL=1
MAYAKNSCEIFFSDYFVKKRDKRTNGETPVVKARDAKASLYVFMTSTFIE